MPTKKADKKEIKKVKKTVNKAKKTTSKDPGYSAKDISVLEGLEAVRKRPGMYIGSTGPRGLHHLIWEVVDNAIDEAMGGYCDKVEISLLPDHMIEVIDNGRGIPTDIHPKQKISALEIVMTKLHAGGKFGGSGYKISGGLHGVGISVVNALSSYTKAVVHRDGKIWEQEFKFGGKPVKKVRAIGKCKDTGTTITFKPDEGIFETTNFSWKTIITHLRQYAYLTKGVHIVIHDKRSKEEKEQDETALNFPYPSYQFLFEGGIASYIRYLNQNKEVRHKNIFYVDKEKDDINVELALQYTSEFTESMFAFTNNIHNPDGGTHVAGFRSALTRTLNSYARTKNILKEKDTNLSGEDVREGLNVVISIKVREPQFEGQTKGKLGNTEAKTVVEQVFGEALAIYLEENPKDAENIINKCLLSARARNAAKLARDTILRKGALEGFTLPGKLSDCSSRKAEESEIFIVEGDSAGGCFEGNTKIALTDGRNLSFKELVKENNQGKINYCYTIKKDQSIGMEKITNPRITKRNTEVIEITLDNGEKITCTPEHKFMLRNGKYEEAQNLTSKISLMPLRKKLSEIKHRITIEGYEMVLNPKTHKWIFTHLLSDNYNLKNNKYQSKENEHKHHIDFNKLNNNPTNIVRMSSTKHLELHRKHIKKTLHHPDAIEKCNKIKRTPEYRQKMSIIMKNMAGELSIRAKKQWQNPEYKEYMANKFKTFYDNNENYRKQNKTLLYKAQEKYWSNNSSKIKQSKKVQEYFDNHPKAKERLSLIAKKQWSDKKLLKWRKEETSKQWTEEFRQKRKTAYNKTYLSHSLSFAKSLLEQEKNILTDYDNSRKELPKRNNNIVKFETLLNRFFNGNSQKLLEAAENYNHKIISIKKLKKKINVYDIEVANTHNFALASGIFVHNSAKQGRNRHTQAILPLRGKVLNVERARMDRILTNNELKSLIIAFGTSIGETFNIEKLRYHKIVIMTDADVDGSHIRTLLLTFFFRYFPDLITSGHIYIAQPPLFGIKYGKTLEYAYVEEDKDTIIEDLAKKHGKNKKAEQDETGALRIAGTKVNVQRYKGLGEMNAEDLWETTMNPEHRKMKRVVIEDAEAANEIFEILMGGDVAPRKKFIQTNAKSVKNLDV